MSLPPPQPPQPPPPKAKRTLWPWFIVAPIGAVVGVGWLLGAGEEDDGGGNSCTRVVYEVTGTARAVDIYARNRTGGNDSLDEEPLPWELSIGCFPADERPYISAQNAGETGSVTCRITDDGEVVASETSTGAFTIATCSG